MPRQERASINVSKEAKAELDSVKSSGQSYDGIIRELVKFWKERKDYWSRRRKERSQSKK